MPCHAIRSIQPKGDEFQSATIILILCQVTYRWISFESLDAAWSIDAAAHDFEAMKRSLQDSQEVLVLGKDDGLGAGIMLTQPHNVASESVNLRTKRAIKVNVLDLIQDSRTDVAVDGVLRMAIMVEFDRGLFLLCNQFLWLVRDLMEVPISQWLLTYRACSVRTPPQSYTVCAVFVTTDR